MLNLCAQQGYPYSSKLRGEKKEQKIYKIAHIPKKGIWRKKI